MLARASHWIRMVVALVVLALAVDAVAARPKRKKKKDKTPPALTYEVVSGDTLSGIAVRFGITVQAIQRKNRLRSDHIRVGQKLVIPGVKGKTKKGEGTARLIRHVVLPGETLGHIARRYGSSIKDIRKRNRLGAGAIIRIGQTLSVMSTVPARERRRFVYRIEPGDTLMSVAARFDMSWKDLQALNPRLKNPRKIRIGDRVVVYKDGPARDSKTVGRASRGKLINAERLPPGPGYYRRTPHRAWGTNETITHLLRAIAYVRQKHPKSHDLTIEDISAKHGGPLKPHKSHQSGRDVDTGMYFSNQPKEGPKALINALKHPLDYEATWSLLVALVGESEAECRVEYIFLEYEVQKLIYTWARRNRKPRSLLRRMFQYPSGNRSMSGVVRHVPGHKGHLHIRFKCPVGDPECI